MLRRASVVDVQSERITREMGYLVVVMRFYPRFLKKEKIDEYCRPSPPADLFTDFKAKDRAQNNHNSAFYQVNYETRFNIGENGRARLFELTQLSRERDVILICQCRDFDRCHCDLLLLYAQARFGAEVRGLIFDYPDFLRRLASPDHSSLSSLHEVHED